MDLALLICLIQLDKVAAWALVPYLLYRLYSLWWGLRFMENESSRRINADLAAAQQVGYFHETSFWISIR